MPALLLGSIGVLAETSDLQRQSFNDAFAEAGLDWSWSREAYAEMLKESGGRDRIATEAERRGETVDADALHARKSALFQQRLSEGVPLRDGVAETMEAARARGWQVAMVSGTSPENVDAILAATNLTRDSFDLVTDGSEELPRKPDPAIYYLALERLGVAPDAALAVEDNPDGLTAAQAAGIDCIAYPGALHDPAGFADARAVTDRLSLPPEA